MAPELEEVVVYADARESQRLLPGLGDDDLRLREVDLASFFAPRTVAVIGASDEPGKPNTGVTNHLRRWAESAGATVYPVNPKRPEVGGLVSYPSIADIPDEIDLAVIVVGDALSALRDAIDKKAKFAVVFSAGFAEVGDEGRVLQTQLEDLVAGSDLRLLGPNTNLNAFEVFRRDLAGPDQPGTEPLRVLAQRRGDNTATIESHRGLGLPQLGSNPKNAALLAQVQQLEDVLDVELL